MRSMNIRYSVYSKLDTVTKLTSRLSVCVCLPALRGLYRSPDGVLFHRWLNLARSSLSVASSSFKILRDYKIKTGEKINDHELIIIDMSHAQDDMKM